MIIQKQTGQKKTKLGKTKTNLRRKRVENSQKEQVFFSQKRREVEKKDLNGAPEANDDESRVLAEQS